MEEGFRENGRKKCRGGRDVEMFWLCSSFHSDLMGSCTRFGCFMISFGRRIAGMDAGCEGGAGWNEADMLEYGGKGY